MDVVHAGVGDFSDVVLGDNGEVDFDTTTVPGTALVKTIASEPTGFDGVDEIIVGDGEDFVIAGGGGDRVNYTLDPHLVSRCRLVATMLLIMWLVITARHCSIQLLVSRLLTSSKRSLLSMVATI